ncbi:hypothetical protein HDU67_000385, partial [Dinochytrium kinnereticum]
GIDLTPELYLVKLCVGSIDPSYDAQDEDESKKNQPVYAPPPGGPYAPPPVQQYAPPPAGGYAPPPGGYAPPPGGYAPPPGAPPAGAGGKKGFFGIFKKKGYSNIPMDIPHLQVQSVYAVAGVVLDAQNLSVSTQRMLMLAALAAAAPRMDDTASVMTPSSAATTTAAAATAHIPPAAASSTASPAPATTTTTLSSATDPAQRKRRRLAKTNSATSSTSAPGDPMHLLQSVRKQGGGKGGKRRRRSGSGGGHLLMNGVGGAPPPMLLIRPAPSPNTSSSSHGEPLVRASSFAALLPMPRRPISGTVPSRPRPVPPFSPRKRQMQTVTNEFHLDELFHDHDKAPDALVRRRGNPIRVPSSCDGVLSVKGGGEQGEVAAAAEGAVEGNGGRRRRGRKAGRGGEKGGIGLPNGDVGGNGIAMSLSSFTAAVTSTVNVGEKRKVPSPDSSSPRLSMEDGNGKRKKGSHDDLVSCSPPVYAIAVDEKRPTDPHTSTTSSSLQSSSQTISSAPSPPSSEPSPTATGSVNPSSSLSNVLALPPPIVPVHDDAETFLKFTGEVVSDGGSLASSCLDSTIMPSPSPTAEDVTTMVVDDVEYPGCVNAVGERFQRDMRHPTPPLCGIGRSGDLSVGGRKMRPIAPAPALVSSGGGGYPGGCLTRKTEIGVMDRRPSGDVVGAVPTLVEDAFTCRPVVDDEVSIRSGRSTVNDVSDRRPSVESIGSRRPSVNDGFTRRPSVDDKVSIGSLERPSGTDASARRPSVESIGSRRPSVNDAFTRRPSVDDELSTGSRRPFETDPSTRRPSCATTASTTDEDDRAMVIHSSNEGGECATHSHNHHYHAQRPPGLGSRLLALSHAQLTALLLAVTEEFGVPEEVVVGMLPGLDVGGVERELEDAMREIYRDLTPQRTALQTIGQAPITTPVLTPAATETLLQNTLLDSASYRRASTHLNTFKTLLLKHSQSLVDAAMHRDYLTLFFPMSIKYLDRLPRFSDPKRNHGTRGVYKRVVSHARWAIGRSVDSVLGALRGCVTGKWKTTAVTTVLVTRKEEGAGMDAEEVERIWGEVGEMIEETVRVARGCKEFVEVVEFRNLVEACVAGRTKLWEAFEGRGEGDREGGGLPKVVVEEVDVMEG